MNNNNNINDLICSTEFIQWSESVYFKDPAFSMSQDNEKFWVGIWYIIKQYISKNSNNQGEYVNLKNVNVANKINEDYVKLYDKDYKRIFDSNLDVFINKIGKEILLLND